MSAGPDAGGGGGGGAAPAAPSDVTAPTVASKVYGFASGGHQYCPQSLYATARSSYNFNGFAVNQVAGSAAYLAGFGSSSQWKGSTASGDSASGSYSVQRAMEGLASSVNSSQTGQGPFKAKQAGHIDKVWLKFYMTAASNSADTTQGLFGDMSNLTTRATVCARIADLAAFVSWFGGDGITTDWETGNWSALGGWANTDARNAGLEAFGFEVGSAIWGVNPALEFNVYSFQCAGSWHQYVNDNGPPAAGLNATLPRVWFLLGLFRAHTTLAATGRIRWLDHWWYRALSVFSGVSTVTALKYNTQGTLASLSTSMPASSRRVLSYFDICCFHWAGTGGGTFYNNTQESEPTYTDGEELYRQWSMGGMRWEYHGPSLTPDSLWVRNENTGLWNGHNAYTFPTGRQTKLIGSCASTSGSYSTTAPALSASASGSGSTRSISGTASHAYGIRCVKAYIYPSGTPVYAQMTFNTGTASLSSGLDNAYMTYVLDLTGVTAGDYAIVTAYSTLDQQHSTVVAL